MAVAGEVGLSRLDAMPEDLRRPSAAAAREERPAAEHGMSLAQGDHRSGRTGGSRRCAPCSDQSTQLVRLSWHQALLLPFWVRRNSSPAQDHGHALRDQQRGHQVAHLPLAERD